MKRSPMNRATPKSVAWARKKSALRRIGARGKARKAKWVEAKSAHLEQEPECIGPSRGLPEPCAGVLDVHHIVPRGSGGGRDYGIYATLCRTHHQWVEMNRREAKELGLLISPWAVSPRERDEE